MVFPHNGTTRMTGEERRLVILDAAHREFSRAGYHGASTSRIAAAAGCSEPMLYKHFAGKQELFTAVLEATSLPIEKRFEELIAAPGRLMENWANGLALIWQDPAYAATMRLRMLALSAVDDPHVLETIQQVYERLMVRLREAIDRGKAEGDIRADVDPEYAFWMWMGIQYASCHHDALRPGSRLEMLPHVHRFIQSIRT